MDPRNLTASLMMILAMGAFAVEDAAIKHLSATVPPGQVVVVIGAVGLIVFGILLRRAGLRLMRPEALHGAALLRNLCEMVGAGAMVMAIALAPLSVVSAILQTMPLTVTLGAALFLGEPVGWRRWTAIAVGFVGMLLILQPGSGNFEPAALLAVLTVVTLSVRDLATRRVPAGVHSLQLAGWGFVSIVPAGLVLLAITGQAPVVPSTAEWGWLFLGAGCGIGGYAALVAATRRGDVAATTPFRYSRLVFAMAIGVMVFGERPDALTLVGAALIVAAGLYSLWREVLRHRVQTAPAAPSPGPAPPL